MDESSLGRYKFDKSKTVQTQNENGIGLILCLSVGLALWMKSIFLEQFLENGVIASIYSLSRF